MAKSPAYWAVWGPAYREHLRTAEREVSKIVSAQKPIDIDGGSYDPKLGREGMFTTDAGGKLSPSAEACRRAACAAHAEASAAHVTFWADSHARRFGEPFAFHLYRSNDA